MKRASLIFGIFAAAALTVSVVPSTARTSATAPKGAATLPNPTVEITYIANEGVLVASGDQQVLIDGLHREYKPEYAFLPDRERERIETAQPPFDNVDLILVSHVHLDHFHAEGIGRHLQNNPNAVLVSSEQVVNAVEDQFESFRTIGDRVSRATPPMHHKTAISPGGIDVEILRLAHAGRRHREIQNLGHLLKLGGKKLLHVGDAELSAPNFEAFDLDKEGIDVAFLPTWFLLDDEAREIVTEYINPRHIVAVHISPGSGEKVASEIAQVFPSAVAFTTLLETRSY